jgi:hypothetical protein
MFRRAGRYVGAVAVAGAVVVSAPAPAAPLRAPVQPVAAKTVQAVAAKSCRAGYTPAVIDGHSKCLHAGEFCRHADDSQYRHYGFRCTHYYRNVHRYRLTRA